MSEASSGRLSELDAAKGLAIILVVAGHVVARDFRPAGNDWYAWANVRLYSFHMAFFFFLAGWVFFLKPVEGWRQRWLKTARRLVPAYVFFCGLVFVAKLLAAKLLPVDRPVGALLSELTTQLLYPTQGVASFLWFIVALLQIQFLAPLLLGLGSRALWIATTLALGAHLAAVGGWVSEVFALHATARYLLFFLLGAWVVRLQAGFQALTRYWLFGLMAFVLILGWAPLAMLPTAAALLSLPVLVGLSRQLNAFGLKTGLIFLGINSFTIYLMNSLCMGALRALILQTIGWDGPRFVPAALLLLAAGLVGPILIQRTLFARVSFLDRISR